MKDFFDEEYEKKQQAEQDMQDKMKDWYAAGAPQGGSSQPTNPAKSPLYIAIIAIMLVLAIIFGWVLCSIFSSSGSSEDKLLSDVMDFMEKNYYLEITDAAKIQAIADAGTAMLQSAGDKFCQLMSPQQYYEYTKQFENTATSSDYDEYFGISVSHYGTIGLYVSEVSVDGSCYGILKTGDIVLKLTDMKDKTGAPVSVDGIGEFSELVISKYDFEIFDTLFAKTYSANFVFLRDGELCNSGIIERGGIGFWPSNVKNEFQFIEYYFDQLNNNISTRNQNKSQHNTYELRGLENLPANTGYVRISQFMYYYNSLGKLITAYDEFVEVMDIFRELGLKRLVLDLKGNPGGIVTAATSIAGMLATSDKLTAAEKSKVTKGNKLLVTSLIARNAKDSEKYYSDSTYYNYFSPISDKCDIVIWTDGNSASASELLTGALRDYGTAFQIGSRTYGKGIAQRIKELPYVGKVTPVPGDKTQEYPWAIYFTVAAYYPPLSENIHGKGYTPLDGYNNILDYGSKTGANTLWGATYRYWGI